MKEKYKEGAYIMYILKDANITDKIKTINQFNNIDVGLNHLCNIRFENRITWDNYGKLINRRLYNSFRLARVATLIIAIVLTAFLSGNAVLKWLAFALSVVTFLTDALQLLSKPEQLIQNWTEARNNAEIAKKEAMTFTRKALAENPGSSVSVLHGENEKGFYYRLYKLLFFRNDDNNPENKFIAEICKQPNPLSKNEANLVVLRNAVGKARFYKLVFYAVSIIAILCPLISSLLVRWVVGSDILKHILAFVLSIASVSAAISSLYRWEKRGLSYEKAEGKLLNAAEDYIKDMDEITDKPARDKRCCEFLDEIERIASDNNEKWIKAQSPVKVVDQSPLRGTVQGGVE